MIHTNRIVTVGEQECIIDRPIVLYRGDREVEIEFTLVGNEFTFSEEGNVIKSVNASHGQLVLNTPSGEHMFSELAECHEGKVVFVVTKEMIDEFIEMGFYSFQIRLYDSAEMKSRVTIPPVLSGFDIRNPIAAEDETNVVDQGIVDYARIFKDQSNEELPTFDWQGNYNKTEWIHHDVITENKMNKIEDALYSINANVKESDVVMLNTLDKVKKDADKYVKEHMAEVEADVDEFERNLNTDVQKFKVDTNAAMTAHKNEVSEVVDGFSTQLAHTKKNGIRCSEIGLIANSKANAINNAEILIEYIKQGFSIIVDDIYYLDRIEETPVLTGVSISLKGDSSKCGFKFDNGEDKSIFKLDGDNNNVYIENLYFENENTSGKVRVFGFNSNNWYIERFKVIDCTFHGNIRLIYGSCYVDPDIYKVGFGTFTLKHNNIKNISIGHFISLYNVPCEMYLIEDNNIHNFNGVILNCIIENTSEYGGEVFKHIKLAIVKNNYVYCDDDWWGTSVGSYYCFVLFEGVKVIYEGNHIEGLKTTEDKTVYDSYLSCNQLYYTNNVWKNNMKFTPAKTNHTLMKSKGGGGDQSPSHRHYEGNTFILEKSKIEELGQNLSYGWVHLLDLMSTCHTWNIINNTFDIYHLIGRGGTNATAVPIINFNFSGNTIRCEKLSGVLMQTEFLEGVDYTKVNHIVSNNTIIANEASDFVLVKHNDNINTSSLVNNLIVENNTIIGNCTLLSSCRADNAYVKNNTVTINEQEGLSTVSLIGGSYLDNLTSINNYFKSNSDTVQFVMLRSPMGIQYYTEDNTYHTHMSGFNYQGIMLAQQRPTTQKIRYHWEDEIVFEEGIQKLDCTFLYGYDEESGYNYIEYENTEGTIIKKLLDNTTNSGSFPIKCNNKTDITKGVIQLRIISLGVFVRLQTGVSYRTEINQRIRTCIID